MPADVSKLRYIIVHLFALTYSMLVMQLHHAGYAITCRYKLGIDSV